MSRAKIFEQMERMHGAIDDLYDTIDPVRKITGDAYLRVEDEYNTLHQMIATEIKGITLKEAFNQANNEYMEGH